MTVPAGQHTVDLGQAQADRPRDELRRVARGGAANLAGSVVAAAAGVGILWLAARVLPADRAGGLFAAVAVFVLAGSVVKLGTQTGLVYWTARLRTLHQPYLLGPILRAALVPVAVASLAGAALLWLCAGWLTPTADPARAADHAGQLRVLAGFLPLAALCDAILAATRGFRAMRPTVIVDRVLRPGLQLLGFIVVAALVVTNRLPRAVTPFAVAWAVPYLPAVVLAAMALRRQAAAATTRPGETVLVEWRRPRTGELLVDGLPVAQRFWSFTWPRAVAGVAQTALQRVDVVLVAWLAGFGAAALYVVAGRFVLLAQLVNQAISQSVQPRLAELLSRGDLDRARSLYQGATGWLVLLAWPPCLLTAWFAPVYLGLFGPGYARGAAVVRVLAVGVLIGCACGMVDMVLSMGGRTTWNLANVCAALAVLVGLDLWLVPVAGARGAAFGLAAAIATNNLVPLLQIAARLRLHPFGRATIRAGVLALAWFGALPAVAVVVAGAGPGALAGCLCAGGAGYAACCWHWREALGLTAWLGGRWGYPRRPVRVG